MSQEDHTQDVATQEAENEQQGESLEDVAQRIQGLEAKIADTSTRLKEKDDLITKLQQETATYRKIINDRGVVSPNVKQQAEVTSNLNKKINALKERLQRGEIDSDQANMHMLDLIQEAKTEGHTAAVQELTQAYQQEQAITRSVVEIFKDEDLQGLSEQLGDLALAYMQSGIASGYTIEQAKEYAKNETKNKINAVKARFGEKPKEEKKEKEKKKEDEGSKDSGFKAEGESPGKKVEHKKTSTEMQGDFISARRAKLAKQKGF